MAEFYILTQKIGIGGGQYGNMFPVFNRNSLSEDELSRVNDLFLRDPVTTSYLRFALVFQNEKKTTLYANLYGDGRWGFGIHE